MRPAHVCAKCPKAKRISLTQVVCTADADGRTIAELCGKQFCPLGLFPDRKPGDWVALAAHVTGLGGIAAGMNGGKPCGGCNKRHEKLNV